MFKRYRWILLITSDWTTSRLYLLCELLREVSHLSVETAQPGF